MDNREFFNKLAHKWDEIAVHNESKLKLIMELSEVKKDGRLLDVGTGTGALIKQLLSTLPKSITAVDLSDKMIEIASSRYQDERVEFINIDVFELTDKGFDYIFLYSVYPHFTDKAAIFEHLHKLAAPYGKIIIAHSESKEKINEIHSKSSSVAEHILPAGEATAAEMTKWFEVDKIIDSEELYYISGIRK